MSAPYRLGDNAKMYYSTTALTAVAVSGTIPSTTADNVRNVQVNAKTDTPDYTTRANSGYKQYAVSIKDAGISFEIKVPAGAADAAYIAFRNAWKNGDEIVVCALTDAKGTTGAEGPTGNWLVSEFSMDQGNDNVLFAKVELKPSTYNDWYVNGS